MTTRPPQTPGVTVGDVELSEDAYWIWTGDRWIPAAGILTRKIDTIATGDTADGGTSSEQALEP